MGADVFSLLLTLLATVVLFAVAAAGRLGAGGRRGRARARGRGASRAPRRPSADLLSGAKAPLRDAVSSIQSRASGERGGLAIAQATQAGALSEVVAERGRLAEGRSDVR